MITWYQCCKATKRQKSEIRKIIEFKDDLKQQNGWKGNYVTEERLSRFEESLIATVNENMTINDWNKRDRFQRSDECWQT